MPPKKASGSKARKMLEARIASLEHAYRNERLHRLSLECELKKEQKRNADVAVTYAIEKKQFTETERVTKFASIMRDRLSLYFALAKALGSICAEHGIYDAVIGLFGSFLTVMVMMMTGECPKAMAADIDIFIKREHDHYINSRILSMFELIVKSYMTREFVTRITGQKSSVIKFGKYVLKSVVIVKQDLGYRGSTGELMHHMMMSFESDVDTVSVDVVSYAPQFTDFLAKSFYLTSRGIGYVGESSHAVKGAFIDIIADMMNGVSKISYATETSGMELQPALAKYPERVYKLEQLGLKPTGIVPWVGHSWFTGATLFTIVCECKHSCDSDCDEDSISNCVRQFRYADLARGWRQHKFCRVCRQRFVMKTVDVTKDTKVPEIQSVVLVESKDSLIKRRAAAAAVAAAAVSTRCISDDSKERKEVVKNIDEPSDAPRAKTIIDVLLGYFDEALILDEDPMDRYRVVHKTR